MMFIQTMKENESLSLASLFMEHKLEENVYWSKKGLDERGA